MENKKSIIECFNQYNNSNEFIRFTGEIDTINNFIKILYDFTATPTNGEWQELNGHVIEIESV